MNFQRLKTAAPRRKVILPAHSAYLKVSCLEMERVRLTKEKETATKRILKIENRLAQIDAEKETLLFDINNAPTSAAPRLNPATNEIEVEPATTKSSDAMTFSY